MYSRCDDLHRGVDVHGMAAIHDYNHVQCMVEYHVVQIHDPFG